MSNTLVMIVVTALVAALAATAVAVRRTLRATRLHADEQRGALEALLAGEREAQERAREADRAVMARELTTLARGQGTQVREAVETVISLAGDKLGDRAAAGAEQLDMRQSTIDRQVDAVTGELRDVRSLVEDLKREKASQHGEFTQALADAAVQQKALQSTTESLQQALASTKTRGQWGERVADDILRHLGFVEGVNFRRQSAIEGGGVPDVTFLLPRDQVLHMDVKFPADNYLRFLDADDDEARGRHLEQFKSDVRDRVKELSRRGYTDGEGTVDVVLLFLPVESIAAFILEHDAVLLDDAMAQGVLICSPSTLFGVLAIVRRAIESFVVERTSDEILERLAGFQQQWDRFVDEMVKVDKQLDTVRTSFDRLTSRRRSGLDRALSRIDDLRSQRGMEAAAEVDLRRGGPASAEEDPGPMPVEVDELDTERGAAAVLPSLGSPAEIRYLREVGHQ